MICHQNGSYLRHAMKHPLHPGGPISGFTLQSADYLQVGAGLAHAGLPTVFVFEGGYAVAEVGVNAVNVLEGFLQAAR